MSDSECESYQPISTEHKSKNRAVRLGKRKPSSTSTHSARRRSDSDDCETYQPASIESKRKPRSTPTNGKSAGTSKKSLTDIDIFGVSKKQERDIISIPNNENTLLNYFVNRVDNGTERRTANIDGQYYIDLKVYRSEDALRTDSSELWKKALIRLKLQVDVNTPEWKKLQNFITSADSLFRDPPKFFEK